MTAGHVAMWGIVGGHRRFSTSRARRGALCGPRVVYRGGWRLPFCAPSRDALPGLSRSSPHIAISAASDPCVGTVDIRGWAMTAGPDTRNGVRIHCIRIRKSAYLFSVTVESFAEAWRKHFLCNAIQSYSMFPPLSSTTL